MPPSNRLIFETDTPYAHYQVWDTVYAGRPARVLYSGQRHTAQSGIAYDDNPDLLFDYNQRLLELVVRARPERVLLIGGGAYTLPIALLTALPSVHLDVVELDAELEVLARTFFGLQPNPRLCLVQGDGRDYLDHNTRSYDLILIDAFLDASTPDSLQTVEAITQYKHNLTPQGLLARNIISAYRGPSAVALHRHIADFAAVFGGVDIFPASRSLPLYVAQNLVLIAQAGAPRPLSAYLRYPALEQP